MSSSLNTVATDASGPADLCELDERDVEATHRRLASARAQHPWGRTETGPVLLRYEDVAAMLSDPALDQIGLGLMGLCGVTDGPLYDWWARIMFANEGERHRQLRSVVRGWLTPRRVGELREPLAEICAATVEGLPRGVGVDLGSSLAGELPLEAICLLLGVDPEGTRHLGEATTTLGMAFGLFGPDEYDEIVSALELLLDWGDDALSTGTPGTLAWSIANAAISGELDRDDAVALIVNLLFAGHDTSRFLIANALWLLGRYPAWWGALHDRSISAAAVVEESLRFQPPVVGTFRVATAPTTFGDLAVAPGEVLWGSLWAAARDPVVYDHPDRFVPGREMAPTLSFGHGVHYCIGAALARLEARVVIETLAIRSAALFVDWENAGMRAGRSGITGIEVLPAVLH